MTGSGAARRVLVWVMTPLGGVVAHLIEPARLRPHSSMPPWRGEPMTGTEPRAAHGQRLLAMELLFDLEPQQRRSRPTSVPSLLILRQPLTVQGCSPSLRCGRFTVSPGRRADSHPPITQNGSTSPLTVPAPSGMTHTSLFHKGPEGGDLP